MLIPLRHAEKLFEKGGLTRLFFDHGDLASAGAVSLNEEKNLQFRAVLDAPYAAELRAKKVDKVNVCAGREVLAALRKLFPSDYPSAQFDEPAPVLRSRLEFVGRMNKIAKRQRELILREDLISNETPGKERILLPIGTKIDDRFFTKVQQRVEASRSFQASYNEEGILVYVSDPVSNVKLRIDILALVTSLPYPIHYAETPAQAIDMFLTLRPKLTVLTQLEKSWESKEVFLACIKQDPFFHYTVYNDSPSGNRDEETAKLRALYVNDYQEKVELNQIERTRVKPVLENEQKKPILERIEILRNNFNKKGFIEMQYYLYRMGQRYNVNVIENILSKVAPIAGG